MQKKKKPHNIELYIMLIIPILYFAIFKYLPMYGVIIAFKDYNIFQGILKSEWIGLAHFKEAFASQAFWQAICNTLILNMGDLLIGFPIPILIAILLNELQGKHVKKAAQVIMYLPHFLSWVIISGIIQQIFANAGFINQIITGWGLEPIGFLSETSNWCGIYWASGVWQDLGSSIIIYIAALSAVDPGLCEAAYIDGANRFKRIWHVTLPMIKPTITMMLIMKLGKIMSISFDRPYLLGNTLVKDASNVISTHVYSLGIQAARFDFATAIGLFQSIVGIILILTANQIAKRFGEEGII
ncbi:MAG: ABC transporter permease subunit [Hungatella sp.]